MRWALSALLPLLLASLLGACAEDPVVPLVQLTGMAPRQIELGDKLEVEGSAFPQGRKARVVFEGALHRPGDATEPDGEVDAEGDVVAPDRIEIAVTDALLSAFCGAGASAVHTTFEGTVTVVFAAQTAGAPPVSGQLQHATLDALPTAAGQARYLANVEDGQKLLRASGMQVDSRASGGLVVTNVEPGSRAAKAGLAPDDVIVSSSGVHAIGVADLAPSPSAAALPVHVQRGGIDEIRSIALDGARSEAPTRFALPATIVASVALALALLAASPGRYVVWLRRRLSRKQGTAASDAFARGLGLVAAAVLPLLVPSADVSLLALVAFTGALAMALIVGTEGEPSTWRAALLVMSRVAPTAVALGGALALAGSLRADELIAAQGAAPWGFFALRSPAHALLALVCVAWGTPMESGSPGAPLPRAAERFSATILAALVVVVFFGGWRLPFTSAHHGGWVWLAAVTFVVKTGLLVAVMLRVRQALPSRTVFAAVRLAWLWMVPLAVFAALGATLWERHVTSRGLTAATTFGLGAVIAAGFAQLAWPRRGSRTRVDPLA